MVTGCCNAWQGVLPHSVRSVALLRALVVATSFKGACSSGFATYGSNSLGEDVLSSASHTVKLRPVNIRGSSHASMGRMQHVLSMAESIFRSTLALEAAQQSELQAIKEDYERNISSQQHYNSQVSAELRALREEVGKARAMNSVSRARIKAMTTGNGLLRVVVHGMGSKVALAAQFVDETLNDTDGKQPDDVQAPEPHKPKATLERLLAESGPSARVSDGVFAGSDQEVSHYGVNLLQGSVHVRSLKDKPLPVMTNVSLRTTGVSLVSNASSSVQRLGTKSNFLQAASKVSRMQELDFKRLESTAASMSEEVKETLSELRAAGASGEAQLHEEFLSRQHDIQSQRQELDAESQELRNSSRSLSEAQGSLNMIELHMNRTRTDLLGRLHGLEQFARQVQRTARMAMDVAALPSASPKPAQQASKGRSGHLESMSIDGQRGPRPLVAQNAQIFAQLEERPARAAFPEPRGWLDD